MASKKGVVVSQWYERELAKIKKNFEKNVSIYADNKEFRKLTYEEVISKQRKSFYDGNNGDKWTIVKKFGCPISHLLVANITQGGGKYQRVIDLQNGGSYGEQYQ